MVRAQARALSIGEPLMCTEDERVLIEVRLASVLSVDLFSAKLFPGGCSPNVAGVRLVVANARAEAIDIEIGFVGNRLPPRRAFRILKKAWSKLHTAAAKKRRDERESRDKRRRRGRGRAQAAVGGAAAAGAAVLGRAASKPAHLLADEVRGVKHAIGVVERAMSAQFDVNFGEESGTDGAALGAGDEGEAGEADAQRALSKAAVAAADLRSRLRRGSVITMRPSELKPVLCAPRAVDIRARDNQAALSTFFAAAFAGPAVTRYNDHFKEFDVRWSRWKREDNADDTFDEAHLEQELSEEGNEPLTPETARAMLTSGARRLTVLRAIKKVVGEKATRVTKVQRAYEDEGALVYEEGSMAHDVPCGNRFVVCTRWRVQPSSGSATGGGSKAVREGGEDSIQLDVEAESGVDFLQGCNLLTGPIRGGAIKEMKTCTEKHLEIAREVLERSGAVAAGPSVNGVSSRDASQGGGREGAPSAAGAGRADMAASARRSSKKGRRTYRRGLQEAESRPDYV